MKLNLLLVGIAFLSLTRANATIAPLPSSYTGIDVYITAGSWINGNNIDQGGAFYGSVSKSGSPTVDTAFWCVDSQLLFSPTQSGYADIIALSNYSGNEQYVRYSSVTNGGTPHWTNTSFHDGSTTYNLAGSAQVRYEMAAYLVSQYDGFTPFTSVTVNARDIAIQDAIWAIMNNSSPSQEDSGFSTLSSGSQVDFWVEQALANYTSINANKWAVVTWNVDRNGNPSVSPDYANGASQTFLVSLAPEPGFYGVVALGLAALFFALRRKKRAEA
jgi:hypothetical protein